MRGKEGVASGWGLTLTDYLGRQQLYFVDVPASLMTIRVSHLQFFLISLLFQAGIYARHTISSSSSVSSVP